ncbi:hypothetical protein V8E53_015583 [Lactarius tabidus]
MWEDLGVTGSKNTGGTCGGSGIANAGKGEITPITTKSKLIKRCLTMLYSVSGIMWVGLNTGEERRKVLRVTGWRGSTPKEESLNSGTYHQFAQPRIGLGVLSPSHHERREDGKTDERRAKDRYYQNLYKAHDAWSRELASGELANGYTYTNGEGAWTEDCGHRSQNRSLLRLFVILDLEGPVLTLFRRFILGYLLGKNKKEVDSRGSRSYSIQSRGVVAESSQDASSAINHCPQTDYLPSQEILRAAFLEKGINGGTATKTGCCFRNKENTKIRT